jgi:hypothetical protein
MEKVRFACPRCQTIMQTGAEKVGYDVACPHCAHRFRLVESSNPGLSGRSAPSPSSDAATLPPTSFPQSSQQAPAGNPGAYQPGSSRSYDVPNLVKPEPAAFDSSGTSPVVSQYPPAVRQTGFCCPYCQTTRPPIWKTEVSQIGWIVFAILLVTTCVFCFVGLFIRDRYRICSQCRIRLS